MWWNPRPARARRHQGWQEKGLGEPFLESRRCWQTWGEPVLTSWAKPEHCFLENRLPGHREVRACLAIFSLGLAHP